MNFPKLDRASRELKLGILTDLAGKNPTKHYNNYIKYVKESSLSKYNSPRDD